MSGAATETRLTTSADSTMIDLPTVRGSFWDATVFTLTRGGPAAWVAVARTKRSSAARPRIMPVLV